MILKCLFGFFVPSVLANPLSIPDGSSIVTPTLNASTSPPSNHPIIECHEELGTRLDIQDCMNAISQIGSGNILLKVADRTTVTPGGKNTMPLPFRQMGSKSCPKWL